MHNQHAGLSQALATQHITERQEQAARARLLRGNGPPSSQPITHTAPVDRRQPVQARLADQATPSQPTIDLSGQEEQ
jgi:hypothetical protein